MLQKLLVFVMRKQEKRKPRFIMNTNINTSNNNNNARSLEGGHHTAPPCDE